MSSKNEESSSSKDEEMRKCLKPNPSNDQVLKAIRDAYGTSNVSIVKDLESYDDRNYLVVIDGKKFLAKVYNGVESAHFLRCSDDTNDMPSLSSIHLYSFIFQHLSQSKYNVQTSQPLEIPGNDAPPHVSIHEFPVVSALHSPAKLALSLLVWVDGSTMASAPILPIETLADAGRYLGNVCVALDDLASSNPAARKAAERYHAWDGKNTLDVGKFLHCIQNEKRRDLVQSVLNAFRTDLLDSGDVPSLREGILMADFNDANIILDLDKNVSGVIDFGDTTYSWRVLDISVAMAYAMMTSYGKMNRSISVAAAMLRGFHSTYPLTKMERKHLRLLIAARLSCSATLGAFSYQQNPENEYLLLHAEPAWKTLELVWSEDTASALDRVFDRACDHCTSDKGLIDCSDIGFPNPDIIDDLGDIRQQSPNHSLTKDTNGTEPAQKRSKISNDDKPMITFVTGNKKKLEEVKRILSVSEDGNQEDQIPFFISNQKIDLPELQGNPIEIAKEKCSLAAERVGGAVITEDTSLCFTALNNLPGPYIKWFLDDCGHDGLNNMIAFSDDKSGYAQTVVGFCPGPGQNVIVFDGRTAGKIVPARGPLNFGWDPIFEPDEGEGNTYAEMTKERKDAISHRSRAFGQLRSYFQTDAFRIKEAMNSSSDNS